VVLLVVLLGGEQKVAGARGFLGFALGVLRVGFCKWRIFQWLRPVA
jgi:hypothetical protein